MKIGCIHTMCVPSDICTCVHCMMSCIPDVRACCDPASLLLLYSSLPYPTLVYSTLYSTLYYILLYTLYSILYSSILMLYHVILILSWYWTVPYRTVLHHATLYWVLNTITIYHVLCPRQYLSAPLHAILAVVGGKIVVSSNSNSNGNSNCNSNSNTNSNTNSN